MQITYPGPHAVVQLPTLGLTVEKGETVDLPTEQAQQLVDQGWKRKPKAAKAAPKKSAAKAATTPAPAANTED